MPRRKTNDEKRLAGTLRRDRVKYEPRLPAGSTRCPNGLPDGARRWWRRLVPTLGAAGLYTVADLPAARDLCVCLARLEDCEAAIDEHGIVVKGRAGGLVRNPAIAAANQYRAAAYKWAAKFGLTPADRSGLSVQPPQEATLAEQLFALVGSRGDTDDAGS